MCSRDCAHTKAATVEIIMIMLLLLKYIICTFGKNNYLLTDLKAYMQGVFIGYRVCAS